MISGTVALPVYNSHLILWLCLESLCRQIKPDNPWELIVFEELHLTQAGENYIRTYEEILREVGCERIVYITSQNKVPLSQKWVVIARNASPTSKYYCLCAADNYYSPWMLCDAEQFIEKADWIITTRGYFYDLLLNKVVLYHYGSMIGLQMIAKTSRVRDFPMDIKNVGVDGWFANNMRMINNKRINLPAIIDGSDHYEQMLCTNGLNNISKKRINYLANPKSPFYSTEKKLEEIIPEDIYTRLMELRKQLKYEWTHDDMAQ